MYHVPMCAMCGEWEVGTFPGGDTVFCSAHCEEAANADADADVECGVCGAECYGEEAHGPDDLSADAEWLASAGYGTDEDYGYYGGDCDY